MDACAFSFGCRDTRSVMIHYSCITTGMHTKLDISNMSCFQTHYVTRCPKHSLQLSHVSTIDQTVFLERKATLTGHCVTM